MPEIIALLKSIPDVVWSSVIASILTLSGVLLSNKGNTARLKIQLGHDASEKAKERTANLRRETYLRTAEELVNINAHLAILPQLDLTKINAGEGMRGFFIAAARLQLIAEPKTAFLVNQLAAMYSELSLTVMTQLIPIANAKSDISIADQQLSRAQAEISRLLSEMAKQNETGQPSQPVFQTLIKSFDFHSAKSDKFAAMSSDAWNRFNVLSADFQLSLLKEIRKIWGAQIPVMIEIRRDLGLTGDLSEMESFMKQQWEKMDAQFNALLLSLKANAGKLKE